MNKERYEKISAPFRTEHRSKALHLINDSLTRLCFVAYPVLLCVLFCLHRYSDLLRAILVPGITFLVLTLIRQLINRPRPYEKLDIDPIIRKDTHGKSMPSRHVFSIFVIAMTFLWVIPPIGVVLLIMGILLAAIRVIAGVHYPSDVIAGAIAGILSGLIGFYLI